MSSGELLWKKYEHEVSLNRGYLDLVLKINIFYYAITGAILSFYFLHVDDEPIVKFSLVLPFLMSLSFIYFFIRSAKASRYANKEIVDLAQAINFNGYSIIAKVLEHFLWIFSILMITVAIGLLVLFFIEPLSNVFECIGNN